MENLFTEEEFLKIIKYSNRSLSERGVYSLLPKNKNMNKQFDDHFYTYNDKKFFIEYIINNLNYRNDKDIDGTEEAIAIGCSQTFGYALPNEFTWPKVLSDISGLNISNLGVPGDSAEGSVNRAIAYCKEYGNPKIIFAVFPIFRTEILNILYKAKTKQLEWYDEKDLKELFATSAMPQKGSLFPKISEAPYFLDDILTIQQTIYYSFNSIFNLIQYCKSNNIKLLWTIHEESDKILDLDCFIKVEEKESLEHLSCHDEYRSHPLFNWAADAKNIGGRMHGHSGIHWNRHVAESFYNNLPL